MHTKDRLARDLMEVGLEDLSVRAARGEFDGFLSDHPNPLMVLIAELAIIGNEGAMRIRQAAIDGAYEASDTDADEWSSSPEGQALFSELTKGE